VPPGSSATDATADETAPSGRSLTGYVCPKCERHFPEDGLVPSHCPDDRTALSLARHWAESRRDPMVGRTLDDRFTLTAKLGAGSMGAVYRARQHAMGREVAVKILRSDRALDEASKARFLREARATSLLASPHTVTVFDFGEAANGELYLAMEILEGESLGARISRMRRIPPSMAVETARQALRSLAEAHAKGIIHRDLKPDNLFYARMVHGDEVEEMVKVLDFGIAKMLGEGAGPINAIETQAGTVFGTPRYMSPEQAQAKPLDGRSDLYSLGVLLYHMLTGRPPFTDDDAIIVMARHIKTAPKPLREIAPDAGISPELEAVILRLLSKEPAQRPANAEAVSQELTRALEMSRAVTSGVRTSVVPVVSERPPGSNPDDSLAPATSSAARPIWPWAFAAVGVFLAIAAAALVAREVLRPRPVVATGVPDRGPVTSASAIATASPDPGGVATLPPPPMDFPTIDVTKLPKTGSEKAPAVAPTGRPRTAGKATSAPATSTSADRGRYGILE
jgi:serine/threonine-protein kinase